VAEQHGGDVVMQTWTPPVDAGDPGGSPRPARTAREDQETATVDPAAVVQASIGAACKRGLRSLWLWVSAGLST
jgi:hypothetical protein